MWKKIILALIITVITLSCAACGNDGNQYNTGSLKKYVEKTKKESSWTPEEREKALKSIFPKMKTD